MTEPLSCLDCNDGITVNHYPIVGLCFRFCPTCQPVCPACLGHGVYPEWTADLNLFLSSFTGTGYQPLLCPGCLGILGVLATSTPESRLP